MFHWLDVERIAEELADAHPGLDPTKVNFVELRDMVEHLEGFEPQPGHPVNERILETIQALWTAERDDEAADDD
ncbi:MAG: Fe-S cluster assembly protein IscX [Planctomycetes bacterium]|nr:Fe-S cluster assembly protein IscX [Planctomycetota bacterium]